MGSQLNVDASGNCAMASRDGAVLFDLERDRLLKLNSVGTEMWRQLRAGCTEAQVVDNIAKQYGVEAETVAKDLDGLLLRLEELGVKPGQSGVSISEPLPVPPDKVHPSRKSGPDANAAPSECSVSLIFCILLGLACCDLILLVGSMKWLCRVVQKWPLKRPALEEDSVAIKEVCDAVEQSCVWYPKKIWCLQRSAVTACLLKRYGVAARMVIGARPIPFLAHAWVEVGGSVVNDSSQVRNLYLMLGSY
jgi:Transglutaminase-like superfamily/Coenzyme PQQ synthesis protein D (PqqD)